MAHFAKIVDNVVEQVVVVHNDYENNGAKFCQDLFGGQWLQCSYNNKIRKQFPGVGFTYDEVRDEFVAPQPYPSWTLDENNDWQSPIPKPDGDYYWNENEQIWVEVENGSQTY